MNNSFDSRGSSWKNFVSVRTVGAEVTAENIAGGVTEIKVVAPNSTSDRSCGLFPARRLWFKEGGAFSLECALKIINFY